jgi:hypothetical protein
MKEIPPRMEPNKELEIAENTAPRRGKYYPERRKIARKEENSTWKERKYNLHRTKPNTAQDGRKYC